MKAKPMPDDCTPSQRKLLDEWYGGKKTVYHNGHFYKLLKITKRFGHRYGWIGGLTWNDIRRDVRNERRRKQREVKNNVGAGI